MTGKRSLNEISQNTSIRLSLVGFLLAGVFSAGMLWGQMQDVKSDIKDNKDNVMNTKAELLRHIEAVELRAQRSIDEVKESVANIDKKMDEIHKIIVNQKK